MPMCCPLSGGDEGPKTSMTRVRTARRRHVCCECDRAIEPGQRYEITTGLWDKHWSTYKTCLLCVEIRNHFGCEEGWTYEALWEQLEDHFFPDMKAGGPCMQGLSPAAKAYLFERRLAWLEADPEHARSEILARNENRWWRFTWAWREIGLEHAIRCQNALRAKDAGR